MNDDERESQKRISKSNSSPGKGSDSDLLQKLEIVNGGRYIVHI